LKFTVAIYCQLYPKKAVALYTGHVNIHCRWHWIASVWCHSVEVLSCLLRIKQETWL